MMTHYSAESVKHNELLLRLRAPTNPPAQHRTLCDRLVTLNQLVDSGADCVGCRNMQRYQLAHSWQRAAA
jgi:hypothetical protein